MVIKLKLLFELLGKVFRKGYDLKYMVVGSMFGFFNEVYIKGVFF